MDPEESARHIMRMYSQSDEPEEMIEAIAHAIRAHERPLTKRLGELHEILTDPVNQLERTKGGYYIYRFDVETMRRIADAIGIEPSKPVDMFAYYTPEELTQRIK